MIKVYLDYGSTTFLIACFDDEETYNVCLPSLEEYAKKLGHKLIERCISKNLSEYDEEED
jgi:hypothetical protein